MDKTSCANTLVYAGQNPTTGVRHYSINQDTLRASGHTDLTPAFYVNVPAADKPAAIAGPYYVQQDVAPWRVTRDTTRPASERRDAYNIAATPGGIWLGGAGNDGASVARITAEAQRGGTVPQFVLYAIPQRDCGSYSSGGLADGAAYRAWVDALSTGIGDRPAVLILEPDAISFCDDAKVRTERSALLTYAAKTIHDRNPNAVMYMHAGSGRPEPTVADMAERLRISGVQYMRGFAMNVASHGTNAEQEAFGDQLVTTLAAMGYPGKHYVIDTSRNGLGRTPNPGAPYNSCNNMNAAIGQRPSPLVDNVNVDAVLWIKRPGGSDGECHPGEPSAGTEWFAALAAAQVANAVSAGTITYWELPANP